MLLIQAIIPLLFNISNMRRFILSDYWVKVVHFALSIFLCVKMINGSSKSLIALGALEMVANCLERSCFLFSQARSRFIVAYLEELTMTIFYLDVIILRYKH